MARKMTEWPSKRGPITKIMPSDGCIGDTVPLAVGKWYDFHEFGWYMGNVGFNIRFSDAMRENLLGVLAGDVSYKIAPGAGVRFRCKKEELLTVEEDRGTVTEQWQMQIDEVDFTIAGGEAARDLDPRFRHSSRLGT